jgi:hypothetical protein
MLSRASVLIFRGLLCGLFFVSQILFASVYSLQQQVSLKTYFADNLSLSTINENERYGGTGALSVDLSRETETSSLSSEFLLEANNYNIKSYSTFDQLANINYIRINERGSWGLNGSYDRNSTRELEEASESFGSREQIDSRVFSRAVGANWNWQLNEKNILAMNANLTDVAYESEFRSGYEYGQGSLLWQHFWSDRLRLQANVSYSLFDSEGSSVNVLSPLFQDVIDAGLLSLDDASFLVSACQVGINLTDQVAGGALEPWDCFEELESDRRQSTDTYQIGIYYVFNEQLVLDFLYGRSYVDSEKSATYINLPSVTGGEGSRMNSQKSDDKGVTYQANINYSNERLQSAFNASRNEGVNGNGTLSLNTRASLNAQYSFNRRHSIASVVQWDRQENSGFSGAEFYDRDIASVMLSYTYRISGYWSLRSVYRLKDLSRAWQSAHGRGNEFHLTVKWSPAKTSWSR